MFVGACVGCRHEKHQNQYRTMFPQNVTVLRDQVYKYPSEDGKEEKYHPVQCEICESELAVQDMHGMYHFFNALAGES